MSTLIRLWRLLFPIKEEINYLKWRIKEAKERIIYQRSHGMTFVKNRQEIIKILGYQDTLGIAVFIQSRLIDNTIDECYEYLTRDNG